MKDGLSTAGPMHGEQFVTVAGQSLMLQWLVISWDILMKVIEKLHAFTLCFVLSRVILQMQVLWLFQLLCLDKVVVK